MLITVEIITVCEKSLPVIPIQLPLCCLIQFKFTFMNALNTLDIKSIIF